MKPEQTHLKGCHIIIPRGFAHGFVVLSETAEFLYKCDN
jgi:dTDP-4-dehydrorhamnose 3,5-epimerase